MDGNRERGARVALDHLFLAPDVHDMVLRHKMVFDPVAYGMFVVIFADARILIDTDVIWAPDVVSEFLDAVPDLAPCVIEIFGEDEGRALIAKAARYLEIVRAMLPEGEFPKVPFFDLRQWGR